MKGVIGKVNLAEKFTRFEDQWQAKIVGEINDTHVKLVKCEGEFVWHHHEAEDEMFLVVKGKLRILLRDGEIVLKPGEFAVIPKGVEHCPVADEEVQVMLLEPKGTVNTGETDSERMVEPEWI